MNLKKTFRHILIFGAALAGAASCVDVDESLGSNFIPGNQQYDVAIAEFPLSNVKMGYCDSLSAYSDTRITIGAVRDSRFGLTTRSSAFTLVPVLDTIDVGLDPVPVNFHFTVTRDTTSVPQFNQQNILQSVNVYALTHVLDTTYMYMWDDRYESFYDSSTRITKGVPVYDGGDSLSFDFSNEFAQKVIDIFAEDPDIQMDLDAYQEKFPGIYLTVDAPVGEGGRINLFDLPIELDEDNSTYVTGCYAELHIKSPYVAGEEPRDTSFLFWFGPEEIDEDADQYALNISTTESGSNFSLDEDGFYAATDKIYVEGGNGMKPWFSAQEIKDLVLEEIATKGLAADEVVINKATITLTYDEPEDYDMFYLMPAVLSPTTKIAYDSDLYKDTGEKFDYVYYANLTDASIDDEDQGEIHRSLGTYSPDITHHVQEILTIPDDSLATGIYDVWLLVLAAETTTTDTSNEELAEYYTYLAYSSYYSSMYSSSYSSSSYSNYYYYLYLASMYSDSSTTSTENTLDRDRYYTASLCGPDSDNGPTLRIVYSYIKQDSNENE